MFISEFIDGSNADGIYLIKKLEVRRNKNNKDYMDLVLADVSGEMTGKFWSMGSISNLEELKRATFAKVSAMVEMYGTSLQIRVDKIEAGEPDDDRLRELLDAGPFSAELMYQEIIQVFDAMKDEGTRRLCQEIYAHYRDMLMYFPAAMKFHHAARGGLLHHVYTMLRAAAPLCQIYPAVDSDLLFAGIALHDIGKLTEMNSSTLGIVRDYSAEGNLIGHVVTGVVEIQTFGARLGIDAETMLLLKHMILSHHGIAEYGSPKKPMTAEAELLHYLDLLDARMYQFEQVLRGMKPGEFMQAPLLDYRMVYRHRERGQARPQDGNAQDNAKDIQDIQDIQENIQDNTQDSPQDGIAQSAP